MSHQPTTITTRPRADETGGPPVIPPIRIRRCRKADLSALEWNGAFTEHRQIIHEAFARQRRGENLMLVADHEGYPVGQIWIDLTKRRHKGAGYLWALRVLPEMRSRGIGKRLLLAAESLLIGRKFALGELGVEKWNTKALKLYRKLGYKIVDSITEEQRYETPDSDLRVRQVEQWVLQKPLRGDANTHDSTLN